MGKDGWLCAIGPHAQNGGITRILADTNIARCADRHIEPTVGPKANQLPAVMAIARQIVRDHHWLGRVVEPGFDLIVAQNPIDFRHIQRTVVKGHAIGEKQPAGQQKFVIRHLILVAVD